MTTSTRMALTRTSSTTGELTVDEILDNVTGLGPDLRFASRREWSLLGARGRDDARAGVPLRHGAGAGVLGPELSLSRSHAWIGIV